MQGLQGLGGYLKQKRHLSEDATELPPAKWPVIAAGEIISVSALSSELHNLSCRGTGTRWTPEAEEASS